MGGCLAHRLDKLFTILAEHTEFADLMRILRSITTNIHKSSQALDHDFLVTASAAAAVNSLELSSAEIRVVKVP